jgi:hypothetical protein
LIVAEGFGAEKQLEEDDTDAPNVDFMSYVGLVLLEALGCLIPVGSNSLRSQLDLLRSFVYYLAQAKVCYLHLPVMEYDVLRLEIIMYNFLFALVQVLQAT